MQKGSNTVLLQYLNLWHCFHIVFIFVLCCPLFLQQGDVLDDLDESKESEFDN